MISAAHNQLQTPMSDGTFNASSGVNSGTNTITFALPHGLHTGDAVTYNAQGQPVVVGLTDGRQYGVIVRVGNTASIQVGRRSSHPGFRWTC